MISLSFLFQQRAGGSLGANGDEDPFDLGVGLETASPNSRVYSSAQWDTALLGPGEERDARLASLSDPTPHPFPRADRRGAYSLVQSIHSTDPTFPNIVLLLFRHKPSLELAGHRTGLGCLVKATASGLVQPVVPRTLLLFTCDRLGPHAPPSQRTGR